MRYGVLFLSGEEIYTMLAECFYTRVGLSILVRFLRRARQTLFWCEDICRSFNLFGDSIQGRVRSSKQANWNEFGYNVDAFADLIMDFGVLGAMVAMFFRSIYQN